MTDSSKPEDLATKHERNRQRRIAGIKRWIEYIETHDEWGEQLNRLVDAQLESARQSGVDADHRRRVDRAGRDRSG